MTWVLWSSHRMTRVRNAGMTRVRNAGMTRIRNYCKKGIYDLGPVVKPQDDNAVVQVGF